MTWCRMAAVLAVAFVGGVAAGADDVNSLAAESLDAQAKAQAINQERAALTREIDLQIQRLWSVIEALKAPALTPEQVEAKKRELEDLKSRLAAAEQAVELGQIQDPAVRAAKLQELETQRTQLQAQSQELAKPVDDKMRALNNAVAGKAQAMFTAMEPYFRDPAAPFDGVTRGSISGIFANGFFAMHWEDKDKKQVAWAHARLRAKPQPREDAAQLDGKYPIGSASGDTIWLWAGYFEIAFVVSRDEWKQPDKVKEAVKAFIDLEGLAKIAPAAK